MEHWIICTRILNTYGLGGTCFAIATEVTINARSVNLDSCHLPAFNSSMLKVCGLAAGAQRVDLRLSDDMKCVPYSCKTGDGAACKICKVQGERTSCKERAREQNVLRFL